MKTRTKLGILLLIIIIFYIFGSFLKETFSGTLKYFLWGFWIVLILSFYYILSKETAVFKTPKKLKEQAKVKGKSYLMQRANYRIAALEQTGFFSILFKIGYGLSFFVLLLGVASLFLNRPNSFDAFLGGTILGLIGLIILFFIDKKNKVTSK